MIIISKELTDGLILTKPRVDLTGMTFNKLTVLRQGPDFIYSGKRRSAWYCKCSCGNEKELLVLGYSLKIGHTKSCGCLSAEKGNENNSYDLTGNYGLCTMKDGNTFIFDIEDYELINKYTWHLVGRGYVGTDIVLYDGDNKRHQKTLQLHRLIMNVHNIEWNRCVVDHINGNILDNRKKNLRVVTQSQNGMNSKLSDNNTSGVAGVSKSGNKWTAYIRLNKERIYLGIYDDFDDAVNARKKAEEKYFGEYSYDKSRKSIENY